MADRVAILLDGGFVTKKLSARLGRFPDAADVGALIERVLAEPCLASRELLRVYYYDAPPITDTVRHPIDGRPHDFSASRAYARNLALQRDLAAMKFARREGVRVILDALGHGIRAALYEHADLVIDSSVPRSPGNPSR